MGARSFVLAWAVLLALAGAVPAQAQQEPIASGGGAEAFDRESWHLAGDRYRRLCDNMRTGEIDAEFRTPPGASPAVAAANRQFITAIVRFCVRGDFIFSGGTEAGGCKERVRLDRRHLSVISSLSLIRSEPMHEVRLECFELEPGAQLRFERLDATSLTLRAFKGERLVILSSTAPGGIRIEGAEITGDILMTRVTNTGIVTIRDSKILNKGRNTFPTVLDVVDSSIQSLVIYRTEIATGINLRALQLARNLEIMEKSHIKGDVLGNAIKLGESVIVTASTVDGIFNLGSASAARLSFSGAKVGKNLVLLGARFHDYIQLTNSTEIGGSLSAEGAQSGRLFLMSNSTVTGLSDFDQFTSELFEYSNAKQVGDLSLQYARISRRLFLLNTTIDGQINGRGARIGAALIISGGSVGKGITFDYSEADRVEILNVKIGEKLDLEYAKVDIVRLVNSTVGTALYGSYARIGSLIATGSTVSPASCKGNSCVMSMFNADIGYLRLRDSNIRYLNAGNARLRVALISGTSTMDRLNCADCLIEQYALIAPRIMHSADLAGAEIRGTLAFGEDVSRASWGPKALLILSELRADAIAADVCDLTLERVDGDRTIPCIEQTEAQRKFVPTSLTGARYRTILPARRYAPAEPEPLEESPSPQQTGTTQGGVMSVAKAAPAPAQPKASKSKDSTPLMDLPAEKLIEFIDSSKSTTYNPQPYEALADALTAAGKGQEAIEIRVARINDRVQRAETNAFSRAWFFIYYHVSQYGYKNWRAFMIFVVLIGIGAVLHFCSARRKERSLSDDENHVADRLLYSIWFSLDRAVPPLRLDPRREEEQNFSWIVRHWFYVHRVAGTVLISVFAAGLAGVGQ